MGVKLRITTKYWMEQMGLPFHPTHINRAEPVRPPPQLRRPAPLSAALQDALAAVERRHRARAACGAIPEYARRFAESTHLYDGDGFEVNEPLCTKMEAQPHDMKPFELLNPQYRYYDYEFERYWHFFQVVRPPGLQPGHARRRCGSGSSSGDSARRRRRSSSRACTGRVGSCRGSSPPAIPTAASP